MSRNTTHKRAKKSGDRPNATALRNADKFIALLRAFKRGAKIQRKGRLSDWHNIDLGNYMKASAVLYRVKQ